MDIIEYRERQLLLDPTEENARLLQALYDLRALHEDFGQSLVLGSDTDLRAIEEAEEDKSAIGFDLSSGHAAVYDHETNLITMYRPEGDADWVPKGHVPLEHRSEGNAAVHEVHAIERAITGRQGVILEEPGAVISDTGTVIKPSRIEINYPDGKQIVEYFPDTVVSVSFVDGRLEVTVNMGKLSQE